MTSPHDVRALKGPATAHALPKLAERARSESWSYEHFAEAPLGSETSSREAHGGAARIRTARFASHKTLEEFDWSFQRSVKKDTVLHLAQLDFLLGKENVVLLGRRAPARPTSRSPSGIRACLAGHRVLFATASDWVARLLDAQRLGRLSDELRRLGRAPLVVVDEIGYVPFDPEAAELMFHLVSGRYERASLGQVTCPAAASRTRRRSSIVYVRATEQGDTVHVQRSTDNGASWGPRLSAYAPTVAQYVTDAPWSSRARPLGSAARRR